MKARLLVSLLSLMLILVYFAYSGAETTGTKKRGLKPHEYGTVVINNYSYAKGAPPVVFPHWLHRSKFTCRLCHVDLGFAMKTGETMVTCEDNKVGIYCGACHDGKEVFGREGVETIKDTEVKNCDRCHSYKKDFKLKNDFYVFRSKLRKERFGNGIDWMHAEDYKRIKLVDYIEGVSFERKKLKNVKEIKIHAQEDFMPNIIFSHTKHTKWSGCELCHPEIFGVTQGNNVYSMQDNFDGKYCGLCHGTVAFPNKDCQRCHTDRVF